MINNCNTFDLNKNVRYHKPTNSGNALMPFIRDLLHKFKSLVNSNTEQSGSLKQNICIVIKSTNYECHNQF